MMEEEYINQRLDKQICWYDEKSKTNKRYFQWLRFFEIIFASLIPFFTGYVDECIYLKYIIGGLGVVVAIIAGILSLFKFQENWIKYRTICETLKHQKYLYITRSTPYDDNTEVFKKFVKNCESIISKENSEWSQQFGNK